MALCLPTLKLFKQKHNPFKTLQPCARSSSSCTSSSFLTSLFSLRLKPLFVFICLYLFLFVFICLYLSLFVFICLYFSLFVFYLSLFVFICLYLSLFVFICLYLFCFYLSLFVFICLYLFLFVFICLYLSLFVFNLSLFVFICQNLPILSNKPCRSNPCCSGSVQTANEHRRFWPDPIGYRIVDRDRYRGTWRGHRSALIVCRAEKQCMHALSELQVFCIISKFIWCFFPEPLCRST